MAEGGEGGGAQVGVLWGGGAGLEGGSRGQASELTDFGGDRIKNKRIGGEATESGHDWKSDYLHRAAACCALTWPCSLSKMSCKQFSVILDDNLKCIQRN